MIQTYSYLVKTLYLYGKANSSLEQLFKWFVVNRLSLNIDKTCYSLFGVKSLENINLELKINDKKIQMVESCKYLGSPPNLCSIDLLSCFCFVMVNKLSLSLSLTHQPISSLEVAPLNPAKGSGKRCKLPQRDVGQNPIRNWIWYILALKYHKYDI